jgi:hypothetical protein
VFCAWLDCVRTGSDGDGDHILLLLFFWPVVLAHRHVRGRAEILSHEPVLSSLAGAYWVADVA